MKALNKAIGTGKKRLRKISTNLTPDQTAHLPVLHPARIGANLPTQQAENMVAEKMSILCDATKRAGAGGIKSGLPMIMPSGRGAFNEFHELFTKEPEKKEEKKGKTWKEIEKEFVKPDLPPYKTVSTPLRFCVWCMTGDKDPAIMEPIVLPINERIERCDMKPGDVFLCWICRPCLKDRNDEYKSPLKVVVGKDIVPIGAIKSMEHHKILCMNIVRVIKAREHLERAGDSEDGRRAQSLGGL